MRKPSIWPGPMLALVVCATATCRHAPVPAPVIGPREVKPQAPRPHPGPQGLPIPVAITPASARAAASRVQARAPVDAAADGPVSLPPIPDGSVVRDAGQPLQVLPRATSPW
jgi:hypothetical protein